MESIVFPLLLTIIAGLCTVLGSVVVLFLGDLKKSHLSFLLGVSAGAMIYLSFMELLPSARESIGFASANIFFFIGMIFIGMIDLLLPQHYTKSGFSKDTRGKLTATSALVIIGIALHNFPEGMAVFISSYSDLKFGMLMALATALHNIPEGIAVSAPIYYATKNKTKSLGYSFIAGVAEPVGALVTFLILRPFISPVFLAYLFAFIAGIMVYISFDELLPASFENRQGHTAIFGVIIGMVLIALSLSFS